MLEQIQEIIQQISSKEVKQANGISDHTVGEVSNEAGNSITEVLKKVVSNGDLSAITALIKGEHSTSNSLVQNIIDHFSGNLTQKVGVEASTSSSLATSIIPQIMGALFGSGSSFNAKDILDSLTGGNSEGGSFLDKLSGLGLDQNGDGKVGLDDAVKAVKDGKLGDILGDFFKK